MLMALLKFLCFLVITCVRIRAHVEDQDIELDRRLKLLNKPAIKTIELSHGVFDCVDIYKQPAFDNPLLKNHKIQMKPTHLSIRSKKIGKRDHSGEYSSGFRLSLDCPNGTVPIRRITKDDLIREKSMGHVKAYHPSASGNPNMHFAALEVHLYNKSKYIGAKSNVGVFKPQVTNGEASAAQVWLSDGNDSISAGWMVNPSFYGDSETHFTAFWMGKGGAGCFNQLCPGFVQVTFIDPIGFILPNISRLKGPLIGKDIWIFQDLSYGGIVKAITDELSPPMGSGGNEECEVRHNSFFRQVQYQINDEALRDIYLPVKTEYTEKMVDCSNYGVHYPCKDIKKMGYYFLYGGPRGRC